MLMLTVAMMTTTAMLMMRRRIVMVVIHCARASVAGMFVPRPVLLRRHVLAKCKEDGILDRSLKQILSNQLSGLVPFRARSMSEQDVAAVAGGLPPSAVPCAILHACILMRARQARVHELRPERFMLSHWVQTWAARLHIADSEVTARNSTEAP